MKFGTQYIYEYDSQEIYDTAQFRSQRMKGDVAHQKLTHFFITSN